MNWDELFESGDPIDDLKPITVDELAQNSEQVDLVREVFEDVFGPVYEWPIDPELF